MKQAYPIILSPAKEGGYVVSVPDLDVNTQGESIADAMAMARDAISLWGVCQQDNGQIIPSPATAQPRHKANEIVTFVDVDFDAYRQEYDMTAERTNVTIPRGLKRKAEAHGISFSQVLQEGLRERLNTNR